MILDFPPPATRRLAISPGPPARVPRAWDYLERSTRCQRQNCEQDFGFHVTTRICLSFQKGSEVPKSSNSMCAVGHFRRERTVAIPRRRAIYKKSRQDSEERGESKNVPLSGKAERGVREEERFRTVGHGMFRD